MSYFTTNLIRKVNTDMIAEAKLPFKDRLAKRITRKVLLAYHGVKLPSREDIIKAGNKALREYYGIRTNSTGMS